MTSEINKGLGREMRREKERERGRCVVNDKSPNYLT